MLPGWMSSDETTKARILAAAKRYLVDHDPATNKWLGTDTIEYSASAGYQALKLVMKMEPSYLSTLPPLVWEKCAPTVLAFPLGERGEDDHEIVRLAYGQAPAATIDTLRWLIQAENRRQGRIFVLPRIGSIWDSRLEKALLEALGDRELTAESFGAVLEVLLKHDSAEAAQVTKSWLSASSSDPKDRRKAVAAAAKLFEFSKDEGWDAVWPAVENDSTFGIEVFSHVTHGSDARDASVVSAK